jgi:hypothetical protein
VNEPSQQPKRKWPWFLLAGVVVFFVSNAFWIYREVQRVKWMKSQRDTNAALFTLPPASRPASTNTSSTNGR